MYCYIFPLKMYGYILGGLPGRRLLADKILPAGAGPPMMRLLPSAVAMARLRPMAVATLTSSLLSSIVRCIAVGIPALATARVSSDAAPRHGLVPSQVPSCQHMKSCQWASSSRPCWALLASSTSPCHLVRRRRRRTRSLLAPSHPRRPSPSRGGEI
jgi:hypothetical protein